MRLQKGYLLRFLRRKEPDEAVQKLIDTVLEEMTRSPAGSDEYLVLMTQLERLYKLKTQERREQVSLNTLVLVAGNLLGLVVIVAYEQKGHLWSSKAASQTIRLRTPDITP